MKLKAVGWYCPGTDSFQNDMEYGNYDGCEGCFVKNIKNGKPCVGWLRVYIKQRGKA